MERGTALPPGIPRRDPCKFLLDHVALVPAPSNKRTVFIKNSAPVASDLKAHGFQNAYHFPFVLYEKNACPRPFPAGRLFWVKRYAFPIAFDAVVVNIKFILFQSYLQQYDAVFHIENQARRRSKNISCPHRTLIFHQTYPPGFSSCATLQIWLLTCCA